MPVIEALEVLMKKYSKIIATLNFVMLGCLILTMVVWGDKLGASHPLIVPFLVYCFISPIPAFIGVVLGAYSAVRREGIKPLLFNTVYFTFGLGVWAVLVIGGASI